MRKLRYASMILAGWLSLLSLSGCVSMSFLKRPGLRLLR